MWTAACAWARRSRTGGKRSSPPAGKETTRRAALDQELQAIFERTYGPVKRRPIPPPARPRTESQQEKRSVPSRPEEPEYLLVDGYNIIFAWDELKDTKQAETADATPRWTHPMPS